MRRYEELSEIFSEKDNYSQSRELLKEVSCCQDKGYNGRSGNVKSAPFQKLAEVKTGRRVVNDNISYVTRCEQTRFSEKLDLVFMAHTGWCLLGS